MSFLFIQFLTGLSSAAVLFLVSSGLSLIFGVTRILNFAHGSLYMLGAFISYSFMQYLGTEGFGFWASLVLAALATGLIGGLIEIVILRRIYAAPELFQILATFALVLIVQDVCLKVWGPQDLLGPQAPGLDGTIKIFGESFPTYDLFLIGLAIFVYAALSALIHKTHFGVLVRCATEDREMVANLGVNQKMLFTGVFVLGSFLAGLGGAFQLPRGSLTLSMDSTMIIDAFVVVVIGGLGSLRGSALAALIVGVVQAFATLYYSQLTLILLFVIMAVVLIIKPYGLFGGPEENNASNARADISFLKPPGRRLNLIWILCGLGFCLLPLMVNSYGLVLATEVLIFALFAASLHFLLGPGGIGVFGHALYFGLGAYAVALGYKYLSLTMSLALLAAPVTALCAVLIFGWLYLRSQGVYLAMLTFAFAQMVWAIVFQWYDVTGGDNGILGVWPSAWASDKTVFYYLVLLLCGSSLLILRHIIFSPFGYSLRAARDNQKRAEAIGLPVRVIQFFGLMLAGAFSGLAGGLFALSKGSVFPTMMDVHITLNAFVITLLGGLQTISGPIVGSVIYTLLESEISRQTQLWRFVLGLIILGLVMFFPNGIVGTLSQIWALKRKVAK